MISSTAVTMPDLSERLDAWRMRRITVRAMAWLCLARLLVGLVPFRLWRGSLGWTGPAEPENPVAVRLARHVERAAGRLPFKVLCLPRAMALSWMLRRARIRNAVVVAIRPPHEREGDDSLHAWVEVSGTRILGDLPGPWHETLRLGA